MNTRFLDRPATQTLTPSKVLGKRILVADDEPGVREALAMLLAVDEHTVTEAANGREALDLFQPGEFDVVLTDYKMPEMRGDELAASINRLAPSQPIIMISAHAQSLAESGKPLVGVSVVLSKPFLLADLRQAIATVLAT